MCCNGVMFHTVKLQPADSSRELAALGLKLKRKKGANYILQPCPQHRHGCCAIYTDRPERCRLFECRQLQRLASGASTEAMALEAITDARRRVAEIDTLLAQSGTTDPRRPLAKRVEKILAEPLSDPTDPAALALRAELSHAMQALESLLDRHFRLARSPEAVSSVGD